MKTKHHLLRKHLGSAALAALLAAAALHAGTPDTVSVDWTDPFQLMPLTGCNFTFDAAGALLVDCPSKTSAQTVANFVPAVEAAIEATQPQILRFPGGTVINTFNWEDATGPISSRPQQVLATTAGSTPSYFGPDEAAKLAADCGSELMVVVNQNRGAADAGNLVTYMNITNGYHVHYWEIGNESGHSEIKLWSNYPTTGDDSNDNGYGASQQTETGQTAGYLELNGGSRNFLSQCAMVYDSGSSQISSWLQNDVQFVSTGSASQPQIYYVKFPPVDTSQTLNVVLSCDWEGFGSPPPFSCSSSTGPSALTPSPAYTINVDSSLSVYDGRTPDPTGLNLYCYLDSTSGEIIFDPAHTAWPAAGTYYVYVDYTSGPHDGYVAIRTAMKNADPSIVVTSTDEDEIQLYDPSNPDVDAIEFHNGAGYQNESSFANPPVDGISLTPPDWLLECITRGYFGYPSDLCNQRQTLTNDQLPSSTLINASEFSMSGNLYDPVGGVPYNRTICASLMYCLMAQEASTAICPISNGQYTSPPINYSYATFMADYLINNNSSPFAAGGPQGTGMNNAVDVAVDGSGNPTAAYVTSLGYSLALLSPSYFGPILLSTSASGSQRSANYQVDNQCNTPNGAKLPQVVVMASKDAANNLYIMGVDTTVYPIGNDSVTVTITGYPYTISAGNIQSTVLSGASLTAYNSPSTPTAVGIAATSSTDVKVMAGNVIKIPLTGGQVRVIKVLAP